MHKILAAISVIVVIILPSIVDSTIMTVEQKRVLDKAFAVSTISGAISYYADEYGVSRELLHHVAQCESQEDQRKIGTAGEIGTFQYMPDTFKRMSKWMGIQLDIHSYADQAKLTAFIYRFYPHNRTEWTCYRKITGI